MRSMGRIACQKLMVIAFMLSGSVLFSVPDAYSEVLSGHVERRGRAAESGNTRGKMPDYGASPSGKSGENLPNTYRARPNGRFGQGGPFFKPPEPEKRSGEGPLVGEDVSDPSLSSSPSPSGSSSPVPTNSFPSTFLGRWHCETEVINSYVRDIAPGTKMVSVVKFLRRPDGRIAADWVQPGWTESQAYAITWSDREARVDRTCYYFADGMQGAWASRSRDHFIMQKADRMICKSYIDQYIDGRYLGRYRTVSVLTRLND